ncbi:glycoside hydrolase family 28 protein, partial [Melanomma pulvis-pyrius CBS 109.77]
REVCTVESFNNSLVDDVPAIAAALKKCGNGERILLSKGTTYTIRSPLDLSPCKSCDFQINGLVKISHDWDYWEKQTAVFKVPNMTAAIIRSDGNTGIIDAQSLGLADPSTIAPARIPKLFSVSDKSYQIHVRDLKIKNVPGTAFYVHSDSTAVRFYGIEFENAAATGFLVDQAQHVYLWNNTIRASGTCVAVLPNSTNIQIEESTCITMGPSASSFGIELRLLAGTGLGWIRNVFVKKIKAVGGMNVIAFSAGWDGGGPHTIEITNATFTDVTIE